MGLGPVALVNRSARVTKNARWSPSGHQLTTNRPHHLLSSPDRAAATAVLKLPNRRRIVFSDGRIPAAVQLSAVGA